MYEVSEFPGQVFETKDELFRALKEHKKSILARKKMTTKHTDAAYSFVKSEVLSESLIVVKDALTGKDEEVSAPDTATLKLVLNTTNLMDSHKDVHIPGIWNKTLKERRDLYLLQEHKASFDSVISDQVKASVEMMSWNDLGAFYKGQSQALIFDVQISRKDNPAMFDRYVSGKVKQHSVGMRYVKYDMAINSESKYYAEEKEIWDKYIDQVVNKEEAMAYGYFYPVLEAKLIEGSAVLLGSNPITPTLQSETKEPEQSTPKQIEPPTGTQIDVIKEINNLKIQL